MLAKTLIVAIFLFIVYALATAMFTLMKDKGQSDRTVKALSFRIGISVALFIIILIMGKFGLISPHGGAG